MEKYINRYRDFYKNMSENTLSSYVKNIKMYFSIYNDLTEENINKLLDTKSNNNSKNVCKCAIIHFWKFLKNFDLIEKEINVEKIQKVAKEEKIPEYLTEEEAHRFMNCVYTYKNITHIVAFKLMINLGLRISEILNLRKRDINLQERTILIRKTKNKKERLIPLNTNCYEMLNNYLLVKNNLDKNLIKLSSVALNNWIKKYAIKANIKKDISNHTLRHTAASYMAEVGMSAFEIARILGHSSLDSTYIYIHIAESRQRINAEKINF